MWTKAKFIEACKDLSPDDKKMISADLDLLVRTERYSNDPHTADCTYEWDYDELFDKSNTQEELWTKLLTLLEQILRNYWDLGDHEIEMHIDSLLCCFFDGEYSIREDFPVLHSIKKPGA